MLLALVWQAAAVAAPACQDPSGKNVDHFFAFKFPNGFDYAYSDSTTSSMLSPEKALDHSTSAVSRTLAGALSAAAGAGHVLWSDQHPDGTTLGAPYAHMKGVVGLNAAGGFWLTHSLPQFPGTTKDAMWATGSKTYGQSFLCVSLDRATIEQLGAAMVTNRPSVYDVHLPAALAARYPQVSDWAVSKNHTTAQDSQVLEIKSKGGAEFTVFAKNSHFGKDQNADMYISLVAPKLGNLIVEVWRHGAGNFDAACEDGKEVDDATGIKLLDQEWTSTQDHSKWAVTTDGKTLCIGDVNRAQGQLGRGGGTWCIKTPQAKTMLAAITGHDKCKKSAVIV